MYLALLYCVFMASPHISTSPCSTLIIVRLSLPPSLPHHLLSLYFLVFACRFRFFVFTAVAADNIAKAKKKKKKKHYIFKDNIFTFKQIILNIKSLETDYFRSYVMILCASPYIYMLHICMRMCVHAHPSLLSSLLLSL